MENQTKLYPSYMGEFYAANPVKFEKKLKEYKKKEQAKKSVAPKKKQISTGQDIWSVQERWE